MEWTFNLPSQSGRRVHALTEYPPEPAIRPSIWILHSTGLGANRQLQNLATALGGHVEVKNTLNPPLTALADRLAGARGRKIPASKRDRLRPPWPDLVLIGGGRSLADAWRIRAASGGKSRIVCIGRPGAALDSVDLVLTTSQYGLPEHPRVLHLDLPLNFPDRSRLEAAAARFRERFAGLPRPWTGVLLGGDSGSYRFTHPVAHRLGRALGALCRRSGGAALITTSPRTRPEILQAALAELDGPHYCYRFQPDDPENPLEAIFALADRFVVTADSASMLAEACATGKPVASFEPELRGRARVLARSWLPPALRPGWERLRAGWTAKGRWIPARRMERIHRSLQARGRIAPVEELDRFEPAARAGGDDLERAVAAVRALL